MRYFLFLFLIAALSACDVHVHLDRESRELLEAIKTLKPERVIKNAWDIGCYDSSNCWELFCNGKSYIVKGRIYEGSSLGSEIFKKEKPKCEKLY